MEKKTIRDRAQKLWYNSFRVSVVALESDFMRHLRAARNTVYRERCFFFFLRIAYLGYAFEEVIFIISV